MTESLRGSVFAAMAPRSDPDELPARYAWDFPNPLAVLACEIRAYDHAQLLQLLDVDHQVVASLVVPLPDEGQP